MLSELINSHGETMKWCCVDAKKWRFLMTITF